VACVSEEGVDIARGLTNYNATEARLIAKHASKEIESLLGYGGDAEIIHRDNLVLL
jgi:glutamate 5-kinase